MKLKLLRPKLKGCCCKKNQKIVEPVERPDSPPAPPPNFDYSSVSSFSSLNENKLNQIDDNKDDMAKEEGIEEVTLPTEDLTLAEEIPVQNGKFIKDNNFLN